MSIPKAHQEINDTFRAMAGRQVRREEPPVVDGVTRFAAGSGDGGKSGVPMSSGPEATNRRLNDALRKAADRVKGRNSFGEVW